MTVLAAREPVFAFVQARLGSTRLPQKMVADLGGKTVLEWVLRRVQRSVVAQNVVLLTSVKPENMQLVSIAKQCGVPAFIGDESDVVSRFYNAAEKWPAAEYIRICADNPFICPHEIDRLFEFHRKGNFDYSFNHIPALGNEYVDGFGAEIFSAKLMNDLSTSHLDPDEKEHVTRFFWNRRQHYNFGVLQAPIEMRFPHLSFDIDTKEDLDKFRSVADDVTLEMTGSEILNKLEKVAKLAVFSKKL